jgi:hypothetical protein
MGSNILYSLVESIHIFRKQLKSMSDQNNGMEPP